MKSAKRRRDIADDGSRGAVAIPNAQLVPVVTRDGHMLRGARLEAATTSAGTARYQRRNIIAGLAQAGARRSDAGFVPMISARHVAIAEILLRDHDEISGGVGVGGVNLLSSSRSATRNSEGRILALRAQIVARDRYVASLEWLGSHRELIVGVVLQGINVHVWGASTGLDRKQLVGYLAAALDRLGEFYQARGINFPRYKEAGKSAERRSTD